MSRTEAVTFTNSQQLQLFGTLHRPSTARSGLPAVVLLSPGVKMRIGPGRLYVPLTDMLLAEGYTVLRFDFHGLGDSAGELTETMLADVYNHIEVGRYVDDTLCALRWLREQHGFQRFILGGLCGGAITATLAAEREPAVDALLSLGITVTMASNAATPAKYLTRVMLDRRRELYFKRLLQPKSWLRFLTFQSEYDVIWRSLKRAVFKTQPAPAAPADNAAAAAEQRGNANPLFPPAFFAFLKRGGRALLLFSEKDRLQSEYEEKFAEAYGAQLQPFEPQLHKHVVANANHVLSQSEWQREMVDVSRTWVTRLYAS